MLYKQIIEHYNDRIQPFCVSKGTQTLLVVSIGAQRMYRVYNGTCVNDYAVSTSRFGIGNKENSFMTPRGVHTIIEKYGHAAPLYRIFADRNDTGMDWVPGTPADNFVLTRILRLAGMEVGINKGPGIDSYERYIYIHGTANEHMIGSPSSHGCICMRNVDVVELFNCTNEGTIVIID